MELKNESNKSKGNFHATHGLQNCTSRKLISLGLRKGLLYGAMILSSLGMTAGKVVAQTAQAVKPKSIAHAVDSIGEGHLGLKLYVAGSDSTTFNRIFGFLYNNAPDGIKKRAVDVLIYNPDTKVMFFVARDDVHASGFIKAPPKILAFLEGEGKNQAGKTVRMASDCNIEIEKQ